MDAVVGLGSASLTALRAFVTVTQKIKGTSYTIFALLVEFLWVPRCVDYLERAESFDAVIALQANLLNRAVRISFQSALLNR